MKLTLDIYVVIALGVIGFSAYEITTRHLLADGSFLQRLWVGVRSSATTAVSHIFAFIGSASLIASDYANDLASEIANLFGDPDIKTRVLALIPSSKIDLVMLGMSIIFYVARRRTQVPSSPS
jgi:hypothetical protein